MTESEKVVLDLALLGKKDDYTNAFLVFLQWFGNLVSIWSVREILHYRDSSVLLFQPCQKG